MEEAQRIWRRYSIGDTTTFCAVLYWAPVERFHFGHLARDYYLRETLSAQSIAALEVVFAIQSFTEKEKPRIKVVRDPLLIGRMLIDYLSISPQNARWFKLKENFK